MEKSKKPAQFDDQDTELKELLAQAHKNVDEGKRLIAEATQALNEVDFSSYIVGTAAVETAILIDGKSAEKKLITMPASDTVH